MNQGSSGGNAGAVEYSNYDVIMLAESVIVKEGFVLTWRSKDSTPTMSVQTKTGARSISTPSDLDYTSATVRPLVTFTINGGSAVRVVFMHLKSANEPAATAALAAAIDAVIAKQFCTNERVIWIGDFNRAKKDHLKSKFADLQVVTEAGGQSQWDLDCAYASGGWKGFKMKGNVVSVSGDNAHAGIAVSY